MRGGKLPREKDTWQILRVKLYDDIWDADGKKISDSGVRLKV